MLSWTPPWLLERAKTVGVERAAVVALTGDAEPDLLADLPGARVGRARMLELAEENSRQINEQLNNWTVVGVPNAGWASRCSASPTSSGSGRSSSSACGSTQTIRWPRGATTSPASAAARGS